MTWSNLDSDTTVGNEGDWWIITLGFKQFYKSVEPLLNLDYDITIGS